MNSLNERKELNKKQYNDCKLKKISMSKIPNCTQGQVLRQIPFPGGRFKDCNIKNLILSKQPSTTSLKSTNYKPKKRSSGKSIPIIYTNNYNEKINESKTLNLTFKKRLCSSGKSKSEKKEDSSITSRKNIKNINIDFLYNIKIEYYLLREEINNILNKNINSENIDEKNKILKHMILKVKKILEKSNKYGNNNKNQETQKEINKKKLSLCIDKYNKINKRLEEISKSNYLTKLNNQIKEIKNRINLYENENKDLLLNNNKNIKNHNDNNAITLPSLPIIKNELDLNLDNQLKNRITEYKDQIAQDIIISKKIKNNEINIKNLERAIEKLNSRYKILSDNYEKGIFTEEDNFNEFKNINININNFNVIRSIIKSYDKINMENDPFEIEKNINFELNCINAQKLTKERSDVNTLENYPNFGEKILSLPTLPRKRKNLSYTNINSNTDNNNKREIKELILKNLDQKEKEEKSLINMHEENNNLSLNKYKLMLKPNFSFNNDYYLFKDERINKIPKMQSFVENKNNLIENFYNNKQSEEIINESINIDESSQKYLDEKSLKKINIDIKTYLSEKNENENNTKKYINSQSNNISIDNQENKNLLSNTVKQREKALNTVMYDSIYE